MYSPYIPTDRIKSLIRGYINVQDKQNDILSSDAKGIQVPDSEILFYQELAESTCLGKLANYYQVPLEDVNGNTDLEQMPIVTRGILKDYFTSYTIYTIISYQALAIGTALLLQTQDKFDNQVRNAETLLIGRDKQGGQLFATRSDLKLSNQYIPRSKTPSIGVSKPNTRYSSGIAFNSRIGGAGDRYYGNVKKSF